MKGECTDMSKLKLKDYWQHIKSLLKGHYSAAMWPVAGISLIYLALLGILYYFGMSIASSIMMNVMMAMYGIGSLGTVGIAVLEVLLIFVIILALMFCYSFFFRSLVFTYQDQIQHPELTVTSSRIFAQFKHVRKNQLLRISLYEALFTWLWTLPLSIVGMFAGRVAWLVIACDVLNALVVIWKRLQYSQDNLLYRDHQPAFLGQSMRRALTASKRYMKGRVLNFLALIFVIVCLPAIIYLAIFGGLAFYGIYTATRWALIAGLVLSILGYIFYVPFVAAALAQYFEDTKDAIKKNAVFDVLFVDPAVLTGEKFVPTKADLEQAAKDNAAAAKKASKKKKQKQQKAAPAKTQDGQKDQKSDK